MYAPQRIVEAGVLMVDVAVTRSLSCNPELYSGPTGPGLFSASWTGSEIVSLLAHESPYKEDVYPDMKNDLTTYF